MLSTGASLSSGSESELRFLSPPSAPKGDIALDILSDMVRENDNLIERLSAGTPVKGMTPPASSERLRMIIASDESISTPIFSLASIGGSPASYASVDTAGEFMSPLSHNSEGSFGASGIMSEYSVIDETDKIRDDEYFFSPTPIEAIEMPTPGADSLSRRAEAVTETKDIIMLKDKQMSEVRKLEERVAEHWCSAVALKAKHFSPSKRLLSNDDPSKPNKAVILEAKIAEQWDKIQCLKQVCHFPKSQSC